MPGTRRNNVSGLPRRVPQATTNELPGGVAHNHGDDDAHHIHRLGNITHTHDDDGRLVFEGDDGQPVVDDGQPLPAEGPGKDQFGSVPGVGYVEPDPPTANELAEAEQELRAEAAEIARRHPDIAVPDQPRPVAVSGAPGSRLADVASRAVHLTMDGYPAEVHDEVIWTEIATHALVSMREEQARTKRGADPALITAARDAISHVAQVRGLA
jgi:hypothetical protein